MPIEYRLLHEGEEGVLRTTAPRVFDHPPHEALTAELLADPRHHIAVAVEEGRVVGFASAMHYVQPDKPPELWINEVGVAETHRRRSIASRLLRALLEEGSRLGCVNAWALTERDNTAAMQLYTTLGGKEDTADTVMFTFPLRGRAGRDREVGNGATI